MKRTSLIALIAFLPAAALAQEVPVVEGSSYAQPPGTMIETPVSNAAQLEVRLSTMEDELRVLRGKNEESQFQIKKLTETLEKMQRDTDMRFGDLTARKPMGNAPMPAPTTVPVAAPVSDAPGGASVQPLEMPNDKTTADKPAAEKVPATSAEPVAMAAPVANPAADVAAAETPRDLYNVAFRLLNQTKYEEAASAFEKFTKQYPKDPLVGNAYYWAGETYYIRRDYVTAADNFRQGFETLPNGPKAPDNLLKLAMSLDALKRDKEACVVLGQIITKFKKTSASVVDKAASEQKRIGCR